MRRVRNNQTAQAISYPLFGKTAKARSPVMRDMGLANSFDVEFLSGYR
jgi:hypothetical protein